MVRRATRIVLLWFVAIAISESALADATLSNSYYTMRWNQASQQIAIVANAGTECQIPNLSVVGKVVEMTSEKILVPQLGSGVSWKLRLEDDITVSVILFDQLPFIGVRKSIRHHGQRKEGGATRTIDKLPVVEATLAFGKPASELVARGTAGLYSLDKEYGSYVFGAVADPQTSGGVVFGWASNRRGQGIVFPGQDGAEATISARVDYGDLRLPAGASEEGELLLMGLFADVRDGLEQYAEATARYLEIQLRPLPCVYCTWYHAGASDERRLAENTAFAAKELTPWGLGVMQIDDHWQPGLKDNGPKRIFDTHDPKGPYPSGMKATADNIRAHGMVAGIWFMPFSGTWLDPFFADKQDIFYKVGKGDATWTKKEMAKQRYESDRPIAELPYSTHWAGTAIDCSNPKSREYVRQMAHRMSHEWGYKYFKMDGFHTGSGSRQKYVDNEYKEDDLGKTTRHDPRVTPIEGYRMGMQVIRDAAGDDVFFLGCCQVQNLRSFGTTFGMLDAMRVGPDNGWRWKGVERGPRYGGRYYFLNKRVWHCDPDPYYVRPELTDSQATMLASWVALSGQLAASSYDYYELPPDRLDIIRRVMPTHDLKTSRPLDFLQRDVPQEWLLTDDTKGVHRVVVGHFNWSADKACTLVTPLEKLGLDPKGQYVGFDYWADRFVSPFTGTLRHELPAASCKVVSIYAQLERPQLVSTSRHITQGIVDVLEEKWDTGKRTLSGVSLVVADDPYELRVIVPGKGSSWHVAAATVEGGAAARVTCTQDGPAVRVTIDPKSTGQLRWHVVFETKQ